MHLGSENRFICKTWPLSLHNCGRGPVALFSTRWLSGEADADGSRLRCGVSACPVRRSLPCREARCASLVSWEFVSGTRVLSTTQPLAKIGAVAASVGVVLLIVSTLLHPLNSDPSDAPAAFAEYAADSHYVWIHLGQFAGFFGLGMGLVAFAATLEAGRAAAWARVGVAGTVASIALAAALQAVDGVALKATVDRWAGAGEARWLVYEAAHAVRQVEIGLASFLSVLFGLTLLAFSLAILLSTGYPAWLGVIGFLDGLGMAAAGTAQASMGFSGLAMTLSMLATSMFLVWMILAGILMWRLAFTSSRDRNTA
jgi:hypothetical protein